MEIVKPTAGALWESLSGQLRAFIRSRVPNDADADDLLQDVFVHVVQKLDSVRQADRIQSWVFQMARNGVIDSYRRQAARAPEVLEVASAPPTAAENNLNAAIAEWLASMIAKLPDTFRDAVRMYEIDGRSQSEIAMQLGISLSGAKSRIQRARRELGWLLRSSCQLERDLRGNIIDCAPKTPDGCGQVSCECAD